MMRTITTHFMGGPNSHNLSVLNNLWALTQLQYKYNSHNSLLTLSHFVIVISHNPESCLLYFCHHKSIWNPKVYYANHNHSFHFGPNSLNLSLYVTTFGLCPNCSTSTILTTHLLQDAPRFSDLSQSQQASIWES